MSEKKILKISPSWLLAIGIPFLLFLSVIIRVVYVNSNNIANLEKNTATKVEYSVQNYVVMQLVKSIDKQTKSIDKLNVYLSGNKEKIKAIEDKIDRNTRDIEIVRNKIN